VLIVHLRVKGLTSLRRVR